MQTEKINATQGLFDLLQANRAGKALGVYSVCSANRFVLEAAMGQCQQDGTNLLIESTSNQVNQFGGYTGQTPRDFAQFVAGIAREQHFPAERILLGGDHLGPHVWRGEPGTSAMVKASALVRDCVLAGYTKIHLDASMPCAGDPGDPRKPLADETVSERAAEMCQAAEAAHARMPTGSPKPLYIIGTEVPIPGGEQLGAQAPEVTPVDAVKQTLEVARLKFGYRGLSEAWDRVIGVVVQPGVEFGDSVVFPYDAAKTRALSAFIEHGWHGVYEAHSTDYQSGAALGEMVRDHFAILKVGPWLTFAFREAVFALAQLEREWLGGRHGVTCSAVPEALEAAMLANPAHWKSYYHGSDAELRLARRYSYSDRSRYYWPDAKVQEELARLLKNLTNAPAPTSLLSQYLPQQAAEVRSGELRNEPKALIQSKIREVLQLYSRACGTGGGRC